MVKKPRGLRMGRLGARTASKVQEKGIVAAGRELAKHPEHIIPKCTEHCRRNPFERVEREIRKIQGLKDDKDALLRYTRRGDQLARAYAASLLLGVTGKVQILASARYPWGEVTYARRDKVKQDPLVGVQHFKDPDWRFLAVAHFVKKHKIYVYSLKDGMACTGKEPHPPREYVTETLARLKYNLTKEGSRHLCSHCAEGSPHMVIDWHSAGIKLEVCNLCSSKDRNSLAVITRRIAGPKIARDFTVSYKPTYKCQTDCGQCRIEGLGQDKGAITAYSNGELSDRQLAEREMEHVRRAAADSGQRLYIVGNQCFGQDQSAFIGHLKPSDEERGALEAILAVHDEPIVEDETSPGKLLAELWGEHGELAIEAIVGSKRLAKALFERYDIAKDSPAHILLEAKLELKKRGIDKTLPRYGKLPPVAALADRVARVYMASGERDALPLVEKHGSKETKVKSLAYAFLLLWGQERGKEWQYTETEREFAEFLGEFAQNLLGSKPEGYHDALQALLQASGSTEEIAPLEKG